MKLCWIDRNIVLHAYRCKWLINQDKTAILRWKSPLTAPKNWYPLSFHQEDQALAKHIVWYKMVDITYESVGWNAESKRWQLSLADKRNDAESTAFVNFGANKTADKMTALDQQRIDIWFLILTKGQIHVIENWTQFYLVCFRLNSFFYFSMQWTDLLLPSGWH